MTIVLVIIGRVSPWNLHESTYIFFSSFSDELSSKKPLLVRQKVLGLFANTLAADEKYSGHYRENFAQPIQKELSKKLNVFSQIFIALMKST